MSTASFSRLRRLRAIHWLFLGALAVGGTGVVVAVANRGPSVVRAPSIGARLELVSGDVTVDDAEKSGRKVLSGEPLAIGSKITAGPGARAYVRTSEGGSLFLRADTAIVLRDFGFELLNGEVWTEVPRIEKDPIRCQAGPHGITASDAGLSIRRHADATTVYVARGLAVLSSSGGRREIHTGEEGKATGQAAPDVHAVAFWDDWTGGFADNHAARRGAGAGAGRIYGVDPSATHGSAAAKLGIAKQVVRTAIRDGIAETQVDQTFSNTSGHPIEGWYWFTVPENAIVTSFALETNGQLVEGEVVERNEAVARYTAAVRASNDPALLEWVNGRTYRARIFPIPAIGTRRVVLRYSELLPNVDGKTQYVYPLRADDGVRFDEFALSVDLGDDATKFNVATLQDARIEENGRKVTMRRSGFAPHADFQLQLTAKKSAEPVRVWRYGASGDQADYVMLRYAPKNEFVEAARPRGDVVVVVDTSAGGEGSIRAQRRAAAEAILRALSDTDRFALVALDVRPTVVYPEEGTAAATGDDIAKALEKLSEHGTGGATDLGAMLEPALERIHGAEQPAVVYVGDGIATSGETAPDSLIDRLRRSLSGSRARFFAVGVGVSSRDDILGELARTGGGEYLRIDEPDQNTPQALRLLSSIKTATITDLDIDLGAGLDQPFYSATGKLARGEEMVLLARTHHPLPAKVKVKGRSNGKEFSTEYAIARESGLTSGFVPRLWASEYVKRLVGTGAEDHRAKVLELGLEYGLATPYTSFLALDSEQAYSQQGIQRRHNKLRGVNLTELTPTSERALAAMWSVPFASVGGCNTKSSPDRSVSSAPEEPGVASKGGEQSRGKPYGALGGADDKSSPFATTPAAPTASATPEAIQNIPPLDETGGSSGLLNARRDRDIDHPRPMSKAPVPLAKKETGLPAPPKTDAPKTEAHVAQKSAPVRAVPPIHEPWRRMLSVCSDAASRPLSERILLWQKRLASASTAHALMDQFQFATNACELPDWKDEAALLNLVQARIDNEQSAEAVLRFFANAPESQRFVARAILRRTSDLRLGSAVARVLFGGRVDWMKVDRELVDVAKTEDRLLHIRAAMLIAPDDPQGDMRLLRELARAGLTREAIEHGRRLRDRGLFTPLLAQEVGDALVAVHDENEALRTYSEIVEFDSNSSASRLLLGDIFLRNGWYDAAYRQYKTLSALDAKSATNWLRLASAAAGTGRTDEALRIERDVRTSEGIPGADDPRQWARFLSASRLASLFAANTADKDAIGRKLKELQLFTTPGTWSILTWDDFASDIALATDDPKRALPISSIEATHAPRIGLSATHTDPKSSIDAWAVHWRGEAVRPVKYRLVQVSWDGQSFSVRTKNGEATPPARKAKKG